MPETVFAVDPSPRDTIEKDRRLTGREKSVDPRTPFAGEPFVV